MRSRVLAVLSLAVLLAAGLSGCTVPGDVQRFLDRAQGRAEFAEVERLREEVVFAVNETPAPPPAFGKVTVLNFTVPPGATDLRVEVTVVFSEAVPAFPLPSPLPRGRVGVLLATPQRALGMTNFTENTAQTYDFEGPDAGTWGVQLQTFGSGRVLVGAVTTERVR